MQRIIALLLSAVTALTMTTSEGYEKMTGLKESIYVLFNKKTVVSEYHEGQKSTDVFDENNEFTFDETTTLIKEKGKDFRILTLDDIHFSDYGYRAFNSIFNTAKIRTLVKRTEPDLIIIPGDFVCGDNSTYYSIKRITDLIEGFGIPWAPVFGNHDDESNCDLNYLADIMMTSPHCLMKKGDSSMGVGNYIIRIAEKNGDALETVECIFMMDSHHSQPNEIQQRWYKRAADGITRLTDGKAEISLFMHIPLPEYQYAYEEAYDAENKTWRDGYDAYGELHEDVCCEKDSDGKPFQRGFFDIIKENENARYVFCAHDHMNDFSLVYNGVRLTYLMKLGLSSGFQPFFDGGSVIDIDSDGISSITHKILICGIMKDIENIQTSSKD